MIGEELIRIQEAQEITKQKKVVPKKDRGQGKDKSKAKKESSNESEGYLDITDDEVEIFDCIEVEM